MTGTGPLHETRRATIRSDGWRTGLGADMPRSTQLTPSRHSPKRSVASDRITTFAALSKASCKRYSGDKTPQPTCDCAT
jgi:hypothetical protein